MDRQRLQYGNIPYFVSLPPIQGHVILLTCQAEYDFEGIIQGVETKMINGLLEKGKRIMIVDDDSDCTFTIKTVLERYGFKVHSFNNAYLALGAYRSNFYDLVILDIILPEMNGFQLFREIKRIDKKVKVCFLSAGQLCYGTYSDIFSTIDASYFIRKPIENQSLVQKIEEIIEVN